MIDGVGLTKKDTEKGGNVQGGSIGTGDKAIALKQCKNILIRDVTIYRGGHFAIIITGCERGTIDNVTIDTNRDGIDIDCCKYITVSNTKVNTPNDDAIVLKSSYALKRAVACEHILITNCIVQAINSGPSLMALMFLRKSTGYAAVSNSAPRAMADTGTSPSATAPVCIPQDWPSRRWTRDSWIISSLPTSPSTTFTIILSISLQDVETAVPKMSRNHRADRIS